MDDEEGHKPVMWLGRDITRVPCFRNTFLYGISGGLGAGLIAFMFTSRPQLACHFGMGSCTVICMCYWIQCRINYSRTRLQMMQIKAGMQRHVMYEGTSMEKALKEQEKEL